MYAIKINGFETDDYFRDDDGNIIKFRNDIAVDQQIHLFDITGYAAPDDCQQVAYPVESV